MALNDRMIKTKENWAKFRRGGEEREVFEDSQDPRLPPGQHVVHNWPVLDIGCKPDLSLEDWRTGTSANPPTRFVSGMVETTWSKYSMRPPCNSIPFTSKPS